LTFSAVATAVSHSVDGSAARIWRPPAHDVPTGVATGLADAGRGGAERNVDDRDNVGWDPAAPDDRRRDTLGWVIAGLDIAEPNIAPWPAHPTQGVASARRSAGPTGQPMRAL
jgi:hypothetical protein